MLGEVGDQLEEGPYLLEPMVEQWDELKHSVRMELMVCTMKMFFKRPPECQKMLGAYLNAIWDMFCHSLAPSSILHMAYCTYFSTFHRIHLLKMTCVTCCLRLTDSDSSLSLISSAAAECRC